MGFCIIACTILIIIIARIIEKKSSCFEKELKEVQSYIDQKNMRYLSGPV